MVTVGGRTIRQARPNVLFEIGWFVGRLGRQRIVVLLDEDAEMHSDFSGVSVIPFRGDVRSAEGAILRELRAAGLVR